MGRLASVREGGQPKVCGPQVVGGQSHGGAPPPLEQKNLRLQITVHHPPGMAVLHHLKVHISLTQHTAQHW